jgi:non-canonical (house-cleaning) NTP pyrophosphatase
MKIIVCSTNFLKWNAVHDAAARVWPDNSSTEIRSVVVTSGVPQQPFGDAQILAGALHRARQVVVARRHLDCYVLAIENGVAERGPDVFVDLAYVVLLDLHGHVTVRSSIHVPVPIELVERSRESGWTTTCGQLAAARLPGVVDPADPHVLWSGGKTHRQAILADAVEDALRADSCAALRGATRYVPHREPPGGRGG